LVDLQNSKTSLTSNNQQEAKMYDYVILYDMITSSYMTWLHMITSSYMTWLRHLMTWLRHLIWHDYVSYMTWLHMITSYYDMITYLIGHDYTWLRHLMSHHFTLFNMTQRFSVLNTE
jgi:hypothetical protein